MGKQDSIATLDLHGFKTDEVFDAVERFLRQSEGKGLKRVRILHGKGTGKVKEQVLKYLRTANYPSQAERMSNGSINEGSLLIFLD